MNIMTFRCVKGISKRDYQEILVTVITEQGNWAMFPRIIKTVKMNVTQKIE